MSDIASNSAGRNTPCTCNITSSDPLDPNCPAHGTNEMPSSARRESGSKGADRDRRPNDDAEVVAAPLETAKARPLVYADASPAQPPAGYRLVPVGPSEEWYVAVAKEMARRVGPNSQPYTWFLDDVKRYHAAMLAAAPQVGRDRCPHGVWAADHCYKCESESCGAEYPASPSAVPEREALLRRAREAEAVARTDGRTLVANTIRDLAAALREEPTR